MGLSSGLALWGEIHGDHSVVIMREDGFEFWLVSLSEILGDHSAYGFNKAVRKACNLLWGLWDLIS